LPKTLNIALNTFNFQWSFPEIVADERGLFESHGLDVRWRDITPKGTADKSALYTKLLATGKTDVYHAGEWACILRVLSSQGARIAAKSVPSPGTTNSTFSLWVRKDSGYSSPRELAGKPVAIELGTGSYYTTLQDLERFIPRSSVKLVQVGEPHKRFLALLEGKVEAASLLSPWADFGEAASLVEILRTKRSNPTTTVVRLDDDADKLKRFFLATNEAIEAIDEHPEEFRELYFRKAGRAIAEMPVRVRRMTESVSKTLLVPRWNPWEAYTRRDFQETYRWMVERDLAQAGHTSDQVVAASAPKIFAE